MKTLLSALVVIWGCMVPMASPAQTNSCDQQDSMPAIRRCLMDESNSHLEAVYGEVLARIADQQARVALETSQAAFIDYRFRSCSAVFEAFQAFGWVADDHATNCVTSLNRQREDFLLEFFED